MTLTKTTVSLRGQGKNRAQHPSAREGYVDERGQVFLPPVRPGKTGKRADDWKQKLQNSGYSFE